MHNISTECLFSFITNPPGGYPPEIHRNSIGNPPEIRRKSIGNDSGKRPGSFKFWCLYMLMGFLSILWDFCKFAPQAFFLNKIIQCVPVFSQDVRFFCLVSLVFRLCPIDDECISVWMGEGRMDKMIFKGPSLSYTRYCPFITNRFPHFLVPSNLLRMICIFTLCRFGSE